MSKPELGHFRKAQVPIKRFLSEFRVTPPTMRCIKEKEDEEGEEGTELEIETVEIKGAREYKVGESLNANHFFAGQYVDVQGITSGKGFAGPMKRWGFSGQPAYDGNTKKHRAHGSIGQCQDPGRVFKGKKMAGQMGGRKRTVQNCFVYKIDSERNLVYVRGQVPGRKGSMVKIRDALRKKATCGGIRGENWKDWRDDCAKEQQRSVFGVQQRVVSSVIIIYLIIPTYIVVD